MLKKISLLLSLLLFLFAVSCGNGVLKPDDYSEESINKDFPYFQIGISNFQISKGKGVFGNPAISDYTVFTSEEKRSVLEYIAIMRLVVNTDEFRDAVLAMTNLGSGNTLSYGGVTISNGTPFNSKTILETIYLFNRDVIYEKNTLGGGASAAGMPGKGTYINKMQGKPDEEVRKGMHNLCYVPNNDISDNYGWVELIFHEHIHNLDGGYGNHHGDFKGTQDIPYAIHYAFGDVLNPILGIGNKDKYKYPASIKDKYAKKLDRLITYYVNKYKHLISYNTVYDPNAQTDDR